DHGRGVQLNARTTIIIVITNSGATVDRAASAAVPMLVVGNATYARRPFRHSSPISATSISLSIMPSAVISPLMIDQTAQSTMVSAIMPMSAALSLVLVTVMVSPSRHAIQPHPAQAARSAPLLPKQPHRPSHRRLAVARPPQAHRRWARSQRRVARRR